MPIPNRKITHVGYVVADLEDGVRWAVRTLGAGPFFHIPHLRFDVCTYDGAPAEYDHSSAFGQWGELIVELTVVHSANPPRLAELMRGQGPQVGHIGWMAENLLADSAALEAEGLPLFHTGSSGPISARWHDARSRLGHHIEILQRAPELVGFYELIKRSSIDWDGADPLRLGPGGA